MRGRLKERKGKGEWYDVVIKKTGKKIDMEVSRKERECNYEKVLKEGKRGSDT